MIPDFWFNDKRISVLEYLDKKKNGPDLVSGGWRVLTPTEYELLQGFPGSWTSNFPEAQRFKMLGNAVSVPVIKAIADKLFRD